MDIEVTNSRLLEMIERDGGLYVPFPALLAPEHFSDERATPETKAKLKAATGPDETGANSVTVRGRLAASCCGWRRQPSVAEFHQTLKSDPQTNHEASILSAWAAEASPSELLLGAARPLNRAKKPNRPETRTACRTKRRPSRRWKKVTP